MSVSCVCAGVQQWKRGCFAGRVPAKDAKQQMEYHCFLVPEN